MTAYIASSSSVGSRSSNSTIAPSSSSVSPSSRWRERGVVIGPRTVPAAAGPETRSLYVFSTGRLRKSSIAIVCVAVALVAGACMPAPPLGIVNTQPAAAPQYPVLSDPAILADGGRYFVYGSNTAQNRMPVHEVADLTTVYSDPQWFNSRIEGMPTKPAWAANDGIFWAPTVAKVGNTYVAFFAANRPNPPQPRNSQCIGRATSSSPTGPFVAEPGPFTCGLNGVGGALDPHLFQDHDGRWYLYAAFSDTDAPIYVLALDANADQARDYYGLGSYYTWPVYGRTWAWEGGFIENPTMIYDP